MSKTLDKILSSLEVGFTKNHGVLIRALNQLPKVEFDFWSHNFNDSDFPGYYSICEMYFYSKYKKIPDKFEIDTTPAFIPYLIGSRKLKRVALDTKEKAIHHFILVDDQNIVYRGQLDTFEESESFTLHVYGVDLDILELNKEFSQFKKQNDNKTIEVGLIKTT